MRPVGSILSRPLRNARFMCSTPVLCQAFGAGGGDASSGRSFQGSASVLTSSSALGRSPTANDREMACRLAEATESKDDRIATIAGDSHTSDCDSVSFQSSAGAVGEIDDTQSLLTRAARLRNAQKPFSERLQSAVANALSDATHIASSVVAESGLLASEIKTATITINLKTTLQSSFPVALSKPITSAHLTHVAGIFAGIHLTALRPTHQFTLINQRDQQMPAFGLLDADEEGRSSATLLPSVKRTSTSYFPPAFAAPEGNVRVGTSAESTTDTVGAVGSTTPEGPAEISIGPQDVEFIITAATSIVDEEFSLTTVKTHSERDSAHLTLTWTTLLHKMDPME